MKYQVVQSEFQGLLVKATANGKLYKLFFTEDLINEHGLRRWMWDTADYYKQFLDQHLDKVLSVIESGYFHSIHDGYDINEIPT